MIDLRVNHKLAPFFQKHKPIKVAIGGRGSGKSRGFGALAGFKMHTEAADIYCLREFQDSINDSVHRVIEEAVVNDMGLSGWTIQRDTIIAPNGAKTRYKGAARNPDSIQSAQGFPYSWFEEAHTISQASLDKLLPTILRNPGSECWFGANPQNSEDPFSKRFILPYQDQLQASGYYEDDLHMIVVINWRDNPWWNDSQETLRLWDYENLPRAKYDWIWEGAFCDSVDDALIMSEWFDSCIDAHVKLGFDPVGIKLSSHDPSDMGEDSKGYAFRHGSVVLDVQEQLTGDVNEGCDWALGHTINNKSDAFTWDCDGMGVSLNRQVSTALDGKQMLISMFKGSEGVDIPDAIYNPADGAALQDQKTNKEAFRNKRAQYYFQLRDRILRTHHAVTNGVYTDPAKMISFSSDIKLLQKLRSEVCRIPIKPNGNGMLELYTKEVMKTKYKIKSPNLADSVMMLMRQPHRVNTATTRRPPSRGTMGRK